MEKIPVISINDVPVAVWHDHQIHLTNLQIVKSEEKLEEKNFTEHPIDPIDAEFFDGYYFRTIGLKLWSNGAYQSSVKKLGSIENGKFYMGELKLSMLTCKKIVNFVKYFGVIELINDGVQTSGEYFPSGEIKTYELIHPSVSFFLKRVKLAFSDWLSFGYLQQITPKPVRTEILALCTKRGCFGYMIDGMVHFRRTWIPSFKRQNVFGDTYRLKGNNFPCEDSIPFSEVDQEALEKFLEDNPSPLGTVAKGMRFSALGMNGFGPGWVIFDLDEKLIKFPRFFLKKAKIFPDSCDSSVKFCVKGFRVMIHPSRRLNTLKSEFIYYLFEKKIPIYPDSGQLWRNVRSRLDEHWGLFDHSVVLFPTIISEVAVFFSEETGDWARYSEGQVIKLEPRERISFCIFSKQTMKELFLTETDLPEVLCDLITNLIYDYFPEDIRSENHCFPTSNGFYFYPQLTLNNARKMLA
jgi:hypothetical protein